MDTTTPSPAELITCGKCGSDVPADDSVYVEGGGQMCRSCFPDPEWMDRGDVDLPF
jgi:hypothetical protein